MIPQKEKKIKGIYLSWIVVADLAKSVKFFSETIGLKVNEFNEEFGWAELGGSEGGALLGIAQSNEQSPIPPGYNAVMTMTVENIDDELVVLKESKVELIGDILEVPGVVKLQTFKDLDGNMFQLVQELAHK